MLMLCGVGLAAESVNIDTPANAGTIVGTYKSNVTVSGAINVTNCTWSFSASDTNVSTSFDYGTNTTANATIYSLVIDASKIEDTGNGILMVTCQSFGETVFTDSNTNIIIDSTSPDIPTSLSPVTNTKDEDGDVTFTCSVNSTETTQGYIEFKKENPGSKTYSDSLESSGTLSITLDNMPNGVYEWRYVASDGTNTSASAYNKLIVSSSSSSGLVIASTDDSEPSNNVGVILAVIVAIIIIVNRKKK